MPDHYPLELPESNGQPVRGILIESLTPTEAINHIGLELGIDVIAEGVETELEYAWLASQGIHLYQGYLFAKPGFESFPKVHYPEI